MRTEGHWGAQLRHPFVDFFKTWVCPKIQGKNPKSYNYPSSFPVEIYETCHLGEYNIFRHTHVFWTPFLNKTVQDTIKDLIMIQVPFKSLKTLFWSSSALRILTHNHIVGCLYYPHFCCENVESVFLLFFRIQSSSLSCDNVESLFLLSLLLLLFRGSKAHLYLSQ